MVACNTTANLAGHLACILSYDGNPFDSAVNYTLLGLNLVYGRTFLVLWATQNHHEQQPLQQQQHTRRRGLSMHSAALASLVLVIVFQIGLCLLLGCAGISIIWCACAGWILSVRRQYGVSSSFIWLVESTHVLLLLDALVIVYYAIPTDGHHVGEAVLTTVAHLCAIGLGMLLFQCSARAIVW